MNAPSFDSSAGPHAAAGAAPGTGPYAFFEGRGATRALRHLEQALAQDDRLVVLTGDEGVGKTRLVQRLLLNIDPQEVWCAQVSAARLPTGDLAGSLAHAFGVPVASPAPGALRRHLAAQTTVRTVLAVVDDAQALPPGALALLGELTREGTLHTLLAGRPALRAMLAHELPLQPATLSCHLEPLQDDETPAYIEHRLRSNRGWDGTPSFSAEAQALVHRFTRGVPLRIDRLCERVMRAARERGDATVSAETVRRIARPGLDEAGIPMLTLTVDDGPPSLGGAGADGNTAHGTGADSPGPDGERMAQRGAVAHGACDGAAQDGADADADATRPAPPRRHLGWALGAVAALGVLAALAAGWVYRPFAPMRLDGSMTRDAPRQAPPPAREATAPAPEMPTPAASVAPATAPAQTRPRPTNSVPSTAVADSPPVPGRCTATVAALGLCTPAAPTPAGGGPS